MDNGLTTDPDTWPVVMTGIEVAHALRLTDDVDDAAAARDSVLRLTRAGRLRPLRFGRSLKYARAEVLAFVERETQESASTGTQETASTKPGDGHSRDSA